MKNFVFVFFTFFVFALQAQIKGTITDSKNNPLSFVNIYLENTLTGTTSNDSGAYFLEYTRKGKQTVVFQMLGFKTLKKRIEITSFPYVLNVSLEPESVELDEVTVSTKENPANEIIRNAIANKDKNTDKFEKYTAKFYSRGLYRIKDAPEKFLGQDLGDFGGGLDSTRSGIIYLSETVSEIKYQKRPKKFTEKIIASKVSGEDNGISFNRAEDAYISFYDNSVEFGKDLVSPISNNAFAYYNFKLVGSFYDKDGRLINKIKMLPKRKNDRVFNGFIYIVEDIWSIYGVDVSVSGSQISLPIVDTLKLKQNYNFSKPNNAWVLISQSIDFKVNFFGFNFNGRFSSAYSNYNFKPNFNDKTFTNEVLTFAENATEKDSSYWNNLRPVPLTLEEVSDYEIKDSIKIVRKSKKYLDSLDTKGNKFNLSNPFFGYTFNNRFEKWSVSYYAPLLQTSFNTVQGFHSSIGLSYFKNQNDKGKWWNAGFNLNYGFSEKKLRPTVYFSKKWNNISRPRLYISGGITTAQFNNREPIKPLDNLIRSLMRRENYLKIYEKEFANISFSQEVSNGIYLNTSLEYANRKPLFNTSNYSFARQSKNPPYTSNNPLDPTDFNNAAFTQHKIATLNIGTRFVFGQKYLSYPDNKFNIGNNKVPTISINYRKTFGAENSEFNSNLFTMNIDQSINAGNFGDFRYNLRGGIFTEQKDIPFMDLLQVKGNQLLFLTASQFNSFNLLEYYKFYTNDRYAEGHLEHNFRGSILGRIPLLNKLNFHLIAGAKTMVMADRKPYSEYSVGLGNLGFGKWRFLRVDYVKSFYGNQRNDGVVLRFNL